MQREYSITQEDINRYGEINGDRDIIHYDHEYAKSRGFEGTLAHGLMVQGYANEVAVEMYGNAWFRRGVIAVKFIGPVYPGDTVVIDIAESGTLTASGPRGPVMVGTAELRRDS